MASLITDPNGTRRIVLICPDGKRRPVRLGKIPLRHAETIRLHIETVIAARRSGTPLPETTASYLETITDDQHAKLAALGLCEPRRASALKIFLEDFIKSLNVKASTITNYRHTSRNLCSILGESRPLSNIKPTDAVAWRQALVDSGLANATVGRRTTTAKTFFNAAVEQRLIRENPFAGLTGNSQINHKRKFFVTRDMAAKLLDAAPDAQWRLLICLSRFGGLRVPSEPLLLTWGDIDWDVGRMRVHSPKTEHHAGQESRVIPIFPEVLKELEDNFHAADPGQFVITRWRSASINLRTMFTKIIKRAGLQPWPKLWHNMRASRQTELADEFPMQVVCSWIGNSPSVARDHYLQVTEEHFDKAARKAARSTHAAERTEAQAKGQQVPDAPQNQGFCAPMRPDALPCEDEKTNELGGEGLEPTRQNRAFNRIFPQSGAPDGALDVLTNEIWPLLDDSCRSAIVAAARAMADSAAKVYHGKY